jgi:hypothetical protein
VPRESVFNAAPAVDVIQVQIEIVAQFLVHFPVAYNRRLPVFSST